MTKRIEFGELRIGDVARQHMADCLDRSWVSAGPKVKQFEDEWGKLFGYRHSRAVSSGTDACINMCLALRAMGHQRSEIIVPALSFIATAHAVRAAGYKPVFVDIDRKTLNIDPDKVEAAITSETAAVMVVHTMGRPCEMRKVVEVAKRRGVLVLEDCCEAHGARYGGKFIGSFGSAAAFSFYIAHLVCCGEGGMVSTNQARVADAVNSTRSHGRKDGALYFDFPNFGLNSKMNDMEASIGLEGISQFWETFNVRHANMMKIHAGLAHHKDAFWASEQDEGNVNCPHGYSVTVRDPKLMPHLKKCLDDANIHWKRNFGCTPTQHGSFKYLGHKKGSFPEAEYAGDNGVHVGLHQYLSDDDVGRIIGALDGFFSDVKGKKR